MKEALIVDTSVWIDFFNGNENEGVLTLVEYIENDYPIYLCPPIIQEILQGVSNDKRFNKIKDNLMCFNVLNDDALESALGAVNIFRDLRKKGYTIRKSNDCLIAYYSIKHSLTILHKDRDFDIIMKHYQN